MSLIEFDAGLGDRHQQIVDPSTGSRQAGHISQSQITNPQSPEYFIGDALGSVRQLVDPAGAVTLTQSYAPYGDVVSSAGTSQTSYAFTGENLDSNGLTFLRARYYAPQDGRFISRDIWNGDYNRPLSLNRWNYVEGNPVNFTDPSGKYASVYASFEGQPINDLDKELIDMALGRIAYRYKQEYNKAIALINEHCVFPYTLLPYKSAAAIFHRIHGGKITFWKSSEDVGYWAQVGTKNFITLNKGGAFTEVEAYRVLGSKDPLQDRTYWSENDYVSLIQAMDRYRRFITHEVGHAFDSAVKSQLPSKTVGEATTKGHLPTPESPYATGGFCGTKTEGWQWRLDSQRNFNIEIFADMYVSWVYDCFDPFDSTSKGHQRGNFMREMMPTWFFHAAKP